MMTITSACRIAVVALTLSNFGCNPGAPQTGEHIERYENGSVSRRVPLVDGKKEGKMIDYFPDGKIMAERLFSKGSQEGRTLIYYPSGKIREAQYFHEGSQEQGDTIWYENGKIQFTVFFLNNKKNGYLRKWSEEGDMIFESKYALDTLIEVKGQPISRRSIEERSKSDTLIRPKNQH